MNNFGLTNYSIGIQFISERHRSVSSRNNRIILANVSVWISLRFLWNLIWFITTIVSEMFFFQIQKSFRLSASILMFIQSFSFEIGKKNSNQIEFLHQTNILTN
ncbi:Long-chain fatty acid transport protein 1 [Sarcoptes scabiei]|nr:Long-chain fatty acid transport protein 1 [Sarcoptes scabiei]